MRLVDDLHGGLPEGAVITDPDLLASYRHDEAAFVAAGNPAVAVLPRDTAQVQHVLRVASSAGVAVVTQGARSGLAGGANAIDGCIVLSTVRMDRIVEVNPADRLAVVEPGVTNAALSRAAADEGLFYPPDPASWEFSTIGGNIATDAGGLCCVKYGVTSQYVLGLEVVLASGEVLRTGRRTVKGVAGYDLTRLIVGSEGTLGVITQATLALRPAGTVPLTLAAVFPSTAAAGAAVTAIIASGAVPALLEIIDRVHLRAIEEYKPMGLDTEAAALLLAQCDTGPQASDDLAALAAICAEAGATEVVRATDAGESAMLLEARRVAYQAIERLGAVIVDDVAVPRSRLADLLDGVERIGAECEVTVGVIGHAGDGNMHPNIVVPHGDAEALERGRRAFTQIMQLGLDLGGTVTGEHGVGLLKRDWLATELGPVGVRISRAVRFAFDPAGILNPGKVV
ncbi:MAG: FAD-linked oxidase C-terminal domain-containing protein [Pseudonocardiales bacterium]